ncbi:MAG: type IX secretion system membrane protein PorP/SprF, partial [Massilibacteroides sp.]|nr:type IX secretion system membrane protein PorP/SprF [Massilibacteroides sp.]
MKRIVHSILLFLFISTAARAQYDAQFSQYFMAMGYYNPAYAGVGGDLNLFGIHRQQWVGIEGAPKSFFVSADMPLRIGEMEHGVGAILFTESNLDYANQCEKLEKSAEPYIKEAVKYIKEKVTNTDG